jgi:hypothetical protein
VIEFFGLAYLVGEEVPVFGQGGVAFSGKWREKGRYRVRDKEEEGGERREEGGDGDNRENKGGRK